MRALVVYESMYGNTRAIATAVAEGLRASCDVEVVPVAGATPELVAGADLLVVGAPTHMHGLPRASSRKRAAEASQRADGPVLDADAGGPGLREWLDALAGGSHTAAAVFDTRLSGPPMLTGRAGPVIARKLGRSGFRLVVAPESFIVDQRNQLLSAEPQRAAQWGRHIAPAVQARAVGVADSE